MKYTVKITQTREGYVEIDAESPQKAVEEANRLYNFEGRELPDMEDSSRLYFNAIVPQVKEEKPIRTGPLTEEEVVNYLSTHGWPNPEGHMISWLLEAEGFRQQCCTEAVRENYDMPDVDRWFHLQDVLQADFSFAAAMFVDNTLWEEDIEMMECNRKEAFLESDLLKGRLSNLAESYNEHGTLEETGYELTVQDLSMIVNALDLQDVIEIAPSVAHDSQTMSPAPEIEAQVYICAGSVKRQIYEGSYDDCLTFCEDQKWEFKDENEFVWDMELEDQRDLTKKSATFVKLAAELENAVAIEYKGIVFDEWSVDKDYESVWGEMCQDCAEKYKGILFDELNEGGIGACSVKGCDVVGADTDNVHHYYVDFKPEHVLALTKELLAERHPELVVPDGRKPALIAQIASAENRGPAPNQNVSTAQRDQSKYIHEK